MEASEGKSGEMEKMGEAYASPMEKRTDWESAFVTILRKGAGRGAPAW
jgi:hypothetical protein